MPLLTGIPVHVSQIPRERIWEKEDREKDEEANGTTGTYACASIILW